MSAILSFPSTARPDRAEQPAEGCLALAVV